MHTCHLGRAGKTSVPHAFLALQWQLQKQGTETHQNRSGKYHDPVVRDKRRDSE